MKRIISSLKTFLKYRELFFTLVLRDIKLRYRKSFLGYIWSVLNPLLIMVVMTIVFSQLFRPNIQYFPIYLLIGQKLFSFATVSTSRSLTSVIDNASMFKKIFIPKYIFTLAVVTSELINLLFMLAALFIVILVLGVPITARYFFILIPIIQIYVFCVGLSLFLAQATVFFKDIVYIWNIFCTAWMYLSVIFYPVDILPENVYYLVTNYNPLYFYITMFRNFIIGTPGMGSMILAVKGAVAAVIMLIIGLVSFSISKRKFILYI